MHTVLECARGEPAPRRRVMPAHAAGGAPLLPRLLTRRNFVSPIIALLGFSLVIAVNSAFKALHTLPALPRRPAHSANEFATAVNGRGSAAVQSTNTHASGLQPPYHISMPPPPPPTSTAHVRAGGPVHTDPSRWYEPRWSVAGEWRKTGAGILFFAYGKSPSTLAHFTIRATRAARSFRMHNYGISLAIVSNNATVDYDIFDTHIIPRDDLVFAGVADYSGRLQWTNDTLTRQWLTRLYYLAHSPYELTWALDSDVMSCTPHAANNFLTLALEHSLWNHHIAHASQNLLVRGRSDKMYSHNFNIVYYWREQTSALFRDWLLIHLRQGVTSDDQKSLHLAELRMLASHKTRIGRVLPELAGSFYSILQDLDQPGGGRARADGARISPVLRGPVHVVHSTDAAACAAFNRDADRERQIVERPSGASSSDAPGTRARSPVSYVTLTSQEDCAGLLGRDAAYYCRLSKRQQLTERPARGNATADNRKTRANGTAASAEQAVVPLQAATALSTNSYIVRASFESLAEYVGSRRCGQLCERLVPDTRVLSKEGQLHDTAISIPRFSPCRNFTKATLGSIKLARDRADSIVCPGKGLLRSFTLTHQGCRTENKLHWMYDCVLDATLQTPSYKTQYMENAKHNRGRDGVFVERLSELNFSCPHGSGLSEFTLSPGVADDSARLKFIYACASVHRNGMMPENHENGTMHTNPLSLVQSLIPVSSRPYFTSETPCIQMHEATYELLVWQTVTCGQHHALSSFRLTSEGCIDGINLAGSMHFVFTCIAVGL